MTIRSYRCAKCGATREKDVPIADSSPKLRCKKCRKVMNQEFGVQTGRPTFQPYVEHDLPGGPVEMTGPKQRDAVMAAHDMTYDSYDSDGLARTRRRNQEEATNVTFDEVMTQIKKDRGEWL